ncbi:hypothetical protein BDN67DRAFT_984715 [Paxillus ammoniavirescens]|nr:hypothetical protein BDN67DRAFT_984715 [Paxillus ammoniavirescens]
MKCLMNQNGRVEKKCERRLSRSEWNMKAGDVGEMITNEGGRMVSELLEPKHLAVVGFECVGSHRRCWIHVVSVAVVVTNLANTSSLGFALSLFELELLDWKYKAKY